MISFRVSEREFELLKIKSEAEGARSISDFARLALCGGAADADAAPPQEIDQLRAEIQQLNACLRQVTDILQQKEVAPPQRSHLAAVARKNGGV